MLKAEKERIRQALRRYGEQGGKGRDPEEERLFGEIGAALRKMRREEPMQARLVELRYLEQRRAIEVMDALYLGRGGASYRRMDIEALSTIAVELAKRGL